MFAEHAILLFGEAPPVQFRSPPVADPPGAPGTGIVVLYFPPSPPVADAWLPNEVVPPLFPLDQDALTLAPPAPTVTVSDAAKADARIFLRKYPPAPPPVAAYPVEFSTPPLAPPPHPSTMI